MINNSTLEEPVRVIELLQRRFDPLVPGGSSLDLFVDEVAPLRLEVLLICVRIASLNGFDPSADSKHHFIPLAEISTCLVHSFSEYRARRRRW